VENKKQKNKTTTHVNPFKAVSFRCQTKAWWFVL